MHAATLATGIARHQWSRIGRREPTLVACHCPSARWPFLCGCQTMEWKVVLRSMGAVASVYLPHASHPSQPTQSPNHAHACCTGLVCCFWIHTPMLTKHSGAENRRRMHRSRASRACKERAPVAPPLLRLHGAVLAVEVDERAIFRRQLRAAHQHLVRHQVGRHLRRSHVDVCLSAGSRLHEPQQFITALPASTSSASRKVSTVWACVLWNTRMGSCTVHQQALSPPQAWLAPRQWISVHSVPSQRHH